jgi:hypothetical protein
MDIEIAGLLTMILFLIFIFIISGQALRYTIQFWASYFRKEKVAVSFILCGFIGFFSCIPVIFVAIITWLISLSLNPSPEKYR